MTAIKEYVIVVDEQDKEMGQVEKLLAHQLGLLHRAFSVFIFRRPPETQQIELLLQQRAANKYHSPLLWTNTCCSHPRAGEDILSAGERRLKEEMGIEAPLNNIGRFQYKAYFPNGLIENEMDYVLIGQVDFDTRIEPNPLEIHDYRWMPPTDIRDTLAAHPEQFTPWFEKALMMVEDYL